MISLLLNKYVLGGILAVLLVAGGWFAYWHHGHVEYKAGIASQQAADAKSLAIYTKARDAQLASAEASYHAETDSLRLHPIALPVTRLCLDLSGSAVPNQAPGRPGSASTAAADLRGMSPGHSAIRSVPGPPIQDLLRVLASRADDTSAQLRALIEAVK